MYSDRNATTSASERRGSGGMHRPSNAAWVLPQAVHGPAPLARAVSPVPTDCPARDLTGDPVVHGAAGGRRAACRAPAGETPHHGDRAGENGNHGGRAPENAHHGGRAPEYAHRGGRAGKASHRGDRAGPAERPPAETRPRPQLRSECRAAPTRGGRSGRAFRESGATRLRKPLPAVHPFRAASVRLHRRTPRPLYGYRALPPDAARSAQTSPPSRSKEPRLRVPREVHGSPHEPGSLPDRGRRLPDPHRAPRWIRRPWPGVPDDGLRPVPGRRPYGPPASRVRSVPPGPPERSGKG